LIPKTTPMKKILFLITVFFCFAFSAKSQITYHHYLDTTYELRYYYAGWNMYTTINYRTTYFDGDTSINGNWYYKVYTRQLDSAFSTPMQVDTMLHGPEFWREDTLGNILYFDADNNYEDTAWKWGEINTWNVGDYYYSCQIAYVDTIYLGTEPLRRWRGSDTTELIGGADRGIVEGVGQTAIMCGLGIEGNGWIACYKRNNIELQFSDIPCSTFLEPVRTDTFTQAPSSSELLAQANSKISVYPVPSDGKLNIVLPDQDNWSAVVTDVQGRTVMNKKLSMKGELHINVSPGFYYLQMTNEHSKENIVQKIIIQ
jgi:hypothetical protein